MKPNKVLREAAKLVRRGHCKGVYARDANGHEVRVTDPNATQFCAVGALDRIEPISYNSCAFALLSNHVGTITEWNDSSTAEQVATTMEAIAEGLEAVGRI